MKAVAIIIFYLFLILFFTACGAHKEGECTNPPPAPDGRPAILIIGDSISYGYMPFIQAALPNYQVIHNPCNGMDAVNGAQMIRQWLAIRPHWAAVTFNHGAWDVSYGRGVTGPIYQWAISVEAHNIHNYTANALFVTTTEVAIHDGTRSVGSEIAYNHEAESVMATMAIPVADIYTLSTQITNLHQSPATQTDSHWQDAASQQFANIILAQLDSLYGIH